EKVAEVVRQADIVGLQKAVAEQVQFLRDQDSSFEWYSVGRSDGDLGGEATPLAWRREKFDAVDKGTFWLSPAPEKVGSKGWDAALPRIASWVRLKVKATGSELVVVNTHFDHRGKQARAKSGGLLRDWIATKASDGPVLLMGDFNALPESPPIKAVLQKPKTGSADALVDARQISKSADPGPNSTWNGFKKIENERRIDHVFVRSLKVEAFETLNPKTADGRFASDHLPVQVTVAM
ncbi:MAG TPA: endonuclease, partial [Planctomycetaceae bacterium]|nr:endonuclease [Planctomycetaceae bacterium]